MAIRTIQPVIPEAPVPVQHGRPAQRFDAGAGAAGGSSASQPPLAPPGGQPVPEASPLDRLVAAALARQGGLARLFAGAAQMAKAGDDLPAALETALARLAGAVLSSPPDAEALRAAVARFGLFHEALALVRRGDGDLKVLLRALSLELDRFLAARPSAPVAEERRRAPPPPPRPGQPPPAEAAAEDVPADMAVVARRLREDADAALARISLHQASALEEARARPPGTRPAALGFEIPVAGPGGPSLVGLRIERDDAAGGRPGGGEGAAVFRVEVAFALAPLGPVRARIGLMPDRRIVAGLWCENPAAVAPLGAELAAIRSELEAAGLEVGALEVHIGRPPPPPPPPPPPHRVDLAI